VCDHDQFIEEWSASINNGIDPNDPPLPDTGYAPLFESNPFPEYGKCYFGDMIDESARGTVYCDHVKRFRCPRDNAPYIQCHRDRGTYIQEFKLKPVVRCDFPAVPE